MWLSLEWKQVKRAERQRTDQAASEGIEGLGQNECIRLETMKKGTKSQKHRKDRKTGTIAQLNTDTLRNVIQEYETRTTVYES